MRTLKLKVIIILFVVVRSCSSLKDPNADTSGHNIEKRASGAQANNALRTVQGALDVLAKALVTVDKGEGKACFLFWNGILPFPM